MKSYVAKLLVHVRCGRVGCDTQVVMGLAHSDPNSFLGPTTVNQLKHITPGINLNYICKSSTFAWHDSTCSRIGTNAFIGTKSDTIAVLMLANLTIHPNSARSPNLV